jgi:hypothetical protein
MSNESYLVVCDTPDIYPSREMSPEQTADRVVACDVQNVPLLWLAMFRPADLVSRTLEPERDGSADDERLAEVLAALGIDAEAGAAAEAGGDEGDGEDGAASVVAPVVSKDRALAQLEQALPVLHRLFAGAGRLDEHAGLLRQAVAGAPGSYVTIELDEVAGLYPPKSEYYQTLREMLATFDGPTDEDADRDRLVDMTLLRTDRPFPPARITGEEPDDDLWNHSRLLGEAWERPLPWSGSPAGAG